MENVLNYKLQRNVSRPISAKSEYYKPNEHFRINGVTYNYEDILIESDELRKLNTYKDGKLHIIRRRMEVLFRNGVFESKSIYMDVDFNLYQDFEFDEDLLYEVDYKKTYKKLIEDVKKLTNIDIKSSDIYYTLTNRVQSVYDEKENFLYKIINYPNNLNIDIKSDRLYKIISILN